MAMANSNVVADILNKDVDLEVVKQQIALQEPNYGLKNCSTPLLQCVLDFSVARPWKSDIFVIGKDLYVGLLILRWEVLCDGEWNFTLRLGCLLEETARNAETFPSFQHFVCKFTCNGTYVEHHNVKTYPPSYVMSQNCFNQNSRFNEINFQLKDCTIKKALVEIYLEPSTTSGYVSPLNNSVVGKIEKLSEKQSLVTENIMLLVSPRFDFGSVGQKLIVQFWFRHEDGFEKFWLYVTLHVINENEALIRQPFSVNVFITIFSQKIGGNNFVKKVVFPKEENQYKSEYYLAFSCNLSNLGCLDNDTLYYKVVVEPK